MTEGNVPISEASGVDFAVAELLVTRELFETERTRSRSLMRRATYAEARDYVDSRLAALGVDTTTLRSGKMTIAEHDGGTEDLV